MKRESGFTLIELVIVIIILGILSVVAIPRFLDIQSDARQATMNGLEAALESASTLTYAKSQIEEMGSKADETLSSGIRIRYGYPRATQTNLKLVLSFNEEDWKLTGSAPSVTFTIESETHGLSNDEIASDDICKLIYTQATSEGEKPDITISGCSD